MLDKNSVLTILGTCFWDEIEEFVTEVVDEFSADELGMLFTEYLVDYARLDEIDELEAADIEVQEEDETEIISGEIRLSAFVNGYAYWDGEEQYLGTEEAGMSFWFQFEMEQGKVVSGIELKEG